MAVLAPFCSGVVMTEFSRDFSIFAKSALNVGELAMGWLASSKACNSAASPRLNAKSLSISLS